MNIYKTYSMFLIPVSTRQMKFGPRIYAFRTWVPILQIKIRLERVDWFKPVSCIYGFIPG